MSESRLVFDAEDIALARLRVPDGNGQALLVDLNDIFKAEVRIREVATVNAQKAPELLMTFNLAHLAASDIVRKLQLNVHFCTKARDMREAVVILDEVPKILAAKGVASARSPGGSEDQRRAVLNQDRQYLDRCNDVAIAESAVALVKAKVKAFEDAYTSVKKILGDNKDWTGLGRPNTSAGAEPPSENQPPGRSFPGFGSRR